MSCVDERNKNATNERSRIHFVVDDAYANFTRSSCVHHSDQSSLIVLVVAQYLHYPVALLILNVNTTSRLLETDAQLGRTIEPSSSKNALLSLELQKSSRPALCCFRDDTVVRAPSKDTNTTRLKGRDEVRKSPRFECEAKRNWIVRAEKLRSRSHALPDTRASSSILSCRRRHIPRQSHRQTGGYVLRSPHTRLVSFGITRFLTHQCRRATHCCERRPCGAFCERRQLESRRSRYLSPLPLPPTPCV